MTRAYIGIGSNVGERAEFCRRAVEALRTSPGISLGAVSSLYETSPVGGPPQRSFVNLVAEVETAGTARERHGPRTGFRWAPRARKRPKELLERLRCRDRRALM